MTRTGFHRPTRSSLLWRRLLKASHSHLLLDFCSESLFDLDCITKAFPKLHNHHRVTPRAHKAKRIPGSNWLRVQFYRSDARLRLLRSVRLSTLSEDTEVIQSRCSPFTRPRKRCTVTNRRRALTFTSLVANISTCQSQPPIHPFECKVYEGEKIFTQFRNW